MTSFYMCGCSELKVKAGLCDQNPIHIVGQITDTFTVCGVDAKNAHEPVVASCSVDRATCPACRKQAGA